MLPSDDTTIISLRNRFRVIHGAEDDFETELCTGATLFAVVLSFHILDQTERATVVRCHMQQTAKTLTMYGCSHPHSLRLIEAILQELKAQIDWIMQEGQRKLAAGEALQ